MDNQNQVSTNIKRTLIFNSIFYILLLIVIFFNFREAIFDNQFIFKALLFALFILIIFPVFLYKNRQFILQYRDKYLKIFIIISIILIIMNIILGMTFSDYLFSISLGLIVIFYLVKRAKKNL